MSVIIRPATTADIGFILKGNRIIDEKSYDHEPPNPLTPERLKRDVFSDNPRCFINVAEFEEQHAAFIMYCYCYFASEGEGLWVTNLYVDPFCRKNNIGKTLLYYTVQKHPGMSGIYGAINRTNNIARHFFSSSGGIRYDDYIIYGKPTETVS